MNFSYLSITKKGNWLEQNETAYPFSDQFKVKTYCIFKYMLIEVS